MSQEAKPKAVTILEMTSYSQSPCDSVLWILANSDGKMKRSRLRRCAGMRLADLDPIIEELARKGRIRIEGEVIILSAR